VIVHSVTEALRIVEDLNELSRQLRANLGRPPGPHLRSAPAGVVIPPPDQAQPALPPPHEPPAD
jgi:hypothetical protein